MENLPVDSNVLSLLSALIPVLASVIVLFKEHQRHRISEEEREEKTQEVDRKLAMQALGKYTKHVEETAEQKAHLAKLETQLEYQAQHLKDAEKQIDELTEDNRALTDKVTVTYRRNENLERETAQLRRELDDCRKSK